MKTMNHAEYIKSTKRMTIESLLYVRQDAQNAINAMPEGQNAGYYADEVHYCSMEIARRKSK